MRGILLCKLLKGNVCVVCVLQVLGWSLRCLCLELLFLVYCIHLFFVYRKVIPICWIVLWEFHGVGVRIIKYFDFLYNPVIGYSLH